MTLSVDLSDEELKKILLGNRDAMPGAWPVVEIVRRTSTLAAFVVTRQIVGANLADKIADSLKEHDLPVFEHRVYQRVAYAETLLEGISVTDRPGAVKARKEVEGIAGELTSLLRRQHESDEQSQYDR